jgi:eukaryotic-like serine/threonine-protein kinase
MFKGEIIKGYTILQDFTTAGGGLSKWTFARKNGREYFFKEFLAPKYPTKEAPQPNSANAKLVSRLNSTKNRSFGKLTKSVHLEEIWCLR